MLRPVALSNSLLRNYSARVRRREAAASFRCLAAPVAGSAEGRKTDLHRRGGVGVLGYWYVPSWPAADRSCRNHPHRGLPVRLQ